MDKNKNDIPLRITEVMSVLNCTKNIFYDYILLDDEFPQPFTIGNCSMKLFSKKEVLEWYEKQKKKNRVPKINK